MKAGYPEAAWRLFQRTLKGPARQVGEVTWAETELSYTALGALPPLPIVRVRGSH
jgi:hypothetical protein